MRRAINRMPRHGQRGVTLIEMVVAIVVTGILLSMVGMFTRNQITSYLDVAARTELADIADTVLRRMTRDLHGALPNSVRVDAGDDHFIEFVPIKDAGRYRAQSSAIDGSGTALDFTSSVVGAFDVFGPAPAVAAGDQLVIYNLGSAAGYSVYVAGTSSRPLPTAGSLARTAGTAQFLLASPQNRFQIVGAPVSYVCDLATGTLWRYTGYAIQAVQPATLATLGGLTGVTSARLATDVSDCHFAYAPGVQQNNGLVSMRLTLTHTNGESVTLLHQVDVMNTP